MKNNLLILDAMTNNKGILNIAGTMEMKDFFKQYPNRSVIISFQVLDDEPTKKLIAYYHYKFVPLIEQMFTKVGDIINPKEADFFLRSISSITNTFIINKDLKYLPVLKELEELQYNELVLFMEDLRLKIATEIGINID